jgi:hypothetical protein
MKPKTKGPSTEKETTASAGKAAPETEPSGNSSSGNPGSMSADEMAAFEKIMGEIEDQEADKLNGPAQNAGDTAADAAQGEAGGPAPTDDFSDELEKVVKEADGGSQPPDVDAVEDGDANLDEDQQKAFESIMAQISGDDSAADTAQGEPEAPAPTDDFSAELEKVVKEADGGSQPPDVDAEDGDGDANPDADQPDTVENLETGTDRIDPGKAGPDSAGSDATVSPAMETADHHPKEEATAAGPVNDDSGDASEDISDDINDILKEITTSDDESDLQESVDDDIVVHEEKMPDPEKKNLEQASAAKGKKRNPTLSDAEPTTDASPGFANAESTPSASSLKAPQKTKPLRETRISSGGIKRKTVIALAVAITICSLGGYFYWDSHPFFRSTAPMPVQSNNRIKEPIEPAPTAKPHEAVFIDDGHSDGSRLKVMADNLDRLRSEVIEKQNEIDELRTYYQAGIDAEIQGVVETIRQADNGILTFKEAMTEPRINLALNAIQRRDTYIKKLKSPVDDLFQYSEELLYLSRKAQLLALMAAKTSDIDIDGFIQQADETSSAHRIALAQLNIDNVTASEQPLKSIWQDIAKKFPVTPVKPEKNHSTTKTDNAALWKSVCDGDFSRKHELTELSTEAARCLAKYKGKDLFLNAVTHLSAEAARGLAAWEGDWLGLNGLKDLTPEAAAHLARWRGKGLSLNGLSRLSPRVVAILSEWQGDQIEMVNVKHMAHWENPKTRLFLSENLKRKRNTARN